MPSKIHDAPLFDFNSYARPGPDRRDRLSPGDVAQISRIARRVPEVMVKVLGRGGHDLNSVRRHVGYLRCRENYDAGIETDNGQRLEGPDAARTLLEDWDLDIDDSRPRADVDARAGRSAKLIHKLVFSMPPGTPPDRVLSAVKKFSRETFALEHRYAMVLHTDEPHPHVHMIVKAISEQGKRLHIRKAELRNWRAEFARQLRALHVPANASSRFVRGETGLRKHDGIYWANLRGASTHMHKLEERARGSNPNGVPTSFKSERPLRTRRLMQQGWRQVREMLREGGEEKLAENIDQFIKEMPLPRTDEQWIRTGTPLTQDRKRETVSR